MFKLRFLDFDAMTVCWSLPKKINWVLGLYTQVKLRIKVRKALVEYNRYRFPEAKADLKSVSKGEIRIEFSGPFCRTCGFYDYFEDFVVILEKMRVKVEIVDVKELEHGSVVIFKVLT